MSVGSEPMKEYHVAIAGATGAVGTEFLNLLEQREFPLASLKLLASERSVGRTIPFRGKDNLVSLLSDDAFEGCDIAFFSAGGSQSKRFAPAAVRAGAVVIDNSSAYRMDPTGPLVIPEVNPQDIEWHRGIIANPNCSTIIMLMAGPPPVQIGRVLLIGVSDYEKDGSAGARGSPGVIEQTPPATQNETVTTAAFP